MTSIWTRQELQEQIALYKEALKACASGASYTIGNHSLTHQDLDKIRSQLKYLADELAALENGRGPIIVQARIPRYGNFPRGRRS